MPHPESTSTERRGVPRQEVSYRLDVAAPGGPTGCLLDVSRSGMRVRFKQELDVAAIEALRIDLPQWLELGRSLEVCGRFVWVRRTDSGATEAGFAFDRLPRKEASVLQVLIQRLSDALAEDAAAA